MKILFDKGSSQVQVDIETDGKRLSVLFEAIKKEGWTYAIGPDRISKEALHGVDCLAILTRHQATQPGTTNPFPSDWDFAYTKEELYAIEHFVGKEGGGLVLISNHGPFAAGDVDWTVYDKVLAAKFDVTIKPDAFQGPGGVLKMSGKDLNPDQKCVLDGVKSIVPHNSCGVSTKDAADFVAHVPSDATPPPHGENYAVRRGKVIVAGNSGIAGSPGTNYPAAGMIDEGDNKQFLLDCFRCTAKREK